MMVNKSNAHTGNFLSSNAGLLQGCGGCNCLKQPSNACGIVQGKGIVGPQSGGADTPRYPNAEGDFPTMKDQEQAAKEGTNAFLKVNTGGQFGGGYGLTPAMAAAAANGGLGYGRPPAKGYTNCGTHPPFKHGAGKLPTPLAQKGGASLVDELNQTGASGYAYLPADAKYNAEVAGSGYPVVTATTRRQCAGGKRRRRGGKKSRKGGKKARRGGKKSRKGGKKSRKGGKKSRRGGRRKTRRGGSVANKVSDAVGGLLSDLEHPTLKFLPASLYGGAKKGSKSKTRPGHEDYETYMGSKRYSEKMLKQLTGRRTMSAPDFPYMGGRPTGSKKGAKSKTRPGHEDYETDMNSKRYSEKMLKRLTGRRTMSAPDFPYAGGARGVAVNAGVVRGAPPTTEMVTEGATRAEVAETGLTLASAQNQGKTTVREVVGSNLKGGHRRTCKRRPKSRKRRKRKRGGSRRRKRGGRKTQRGGYTQYQANTPLTRTMQTPNGPQGGSWIGQLATPPTYKVLDNCVDNYNRFTNSGKPTGVYDQAAPPTPFGGTAK